MKQVILLLSITFVFPAISMDESTKKFFEAAEKGDVDTVTKLLVEKKADITMKNEDGDTALMVAVKNNQIPMLSKLIERLGETNQIDEKNKKGQTALALAIEEKNLEIIKVLVGAQAKVDKPLLRLAIETDDVNIIEEILNSVPDSDIIGKALRSINIFSDNKDKILALLEKAQNQYKLYEKIKEKKPDSDISDIKTFIDTNLIISLNVRNPVRNPLIAAIATNNLELVTFLIEKGANVNHIFQDTTPLNFAFEMADDNFPMIELLLSKGADTNAFLGQIDQPHPLIFLAMLAEPNKPGLIKLLAKYKMKIDAQMSIELPGFIFNGTPLMIAALRADVEMVKILLELGADPSATNKEGETAITMVKAELAKAGVPLEKQKGFNEIIALLQAKEKEIADSLQKKLFTSIQNLTQSLRALEQKLAIK